MELDQEKLFCSPGIQQSQELQPGTGCSPRLPVPCPSSCFLPKQLSLCSKAQGFVTKAGPDTGRMTPPRTFLLPTAKVTRGSCSPFSFPPLESLPLQFVLKVKSPPQKQQLPPGQTPARDAKQPSQPGGLPCCTPAGELSLAAGLGSGCPNEFPAQLSAQSSALTHANPPQTRHRCSPCPAPPAPSACAPIESKQV